jgi:multidrug efflux pump subunit AcrA (membrane-fusion protein)
VGAGTAVVTLLDPNLVRVDATLDESNVTRVKQDMRAIVTFDALQGQPFVGRVAVVTPAGTTTQGVVTYPITIVFDPRGTTIPAGLTATVRIVTDSRSNVLTVRSNAVRREGNNRVVDVVGADGKLTARTVKVGLTGDGGIVEITEGLNEGERIAIHSAQRSTQQTGGTFGAGGLPGLGAPAAQPVRR